VAKMTKLRSFYDFNRLVESTATYNDLIREFPEFNLIFKSYCKHFFIKGSQAQVMGEASSSEEAVEMEPKEEATIKPKAKPKTTGN
jgi:hypothetical protein